MTTLALLVVLGVVAVVIWVNLNANNRNRTRVGPQRAPERTADPSVINRSDTGDVTPPATGATTGDTHRDVELATEIASPTTVTPTASVAPAATGAPQTAAPTTMPQASAATFAPDRSFAYEMADELQGTDAETQWPVLPTQPTQAGLGEDRVVATIRSPRSLYVYWELKGNTAQHVKNAVGSTEWSASRPCLRIFDVTGKLEPDQENASGWSIDLNEADDHCFINEGIEPGHRYLISYERHTPDGRYFEVAQAIPVEMPPEGVANESMLNQSFGGQPAQWSGSQVNQQQPGAKSDVKWQ
ncbi:MAG: DUF4912 domain-containing protein [Mycobacterium leprae]